MHDLFKLVRGNAYPGRGIVLGRTEDGRHCRIAYFIMGRSENSRNRIFAQTEDGIKTEAFDPSRLTDPSLVIYHPVRRYDGLTIVTNGDQTDTIRDFLRDDNGFRPALLTREFEPDAPNYTPRISGIVLRDGGYKLSILKTLEGDPRCCCRYFFEYEKTVPGIGHFIHTYRGDGNPLPSFEGEPVCVPIRGTAQEFADTLWAALSEENKVSLYVCEQEIATGEFHEIIINKNS